MQNTQSTSVKRSSDILSAAKRQSVFSGALLHSFSPYPLIVHSHLRWDWVWQRPQQFLSRLAKKHRILFVEGPFVEDNEDAPRYTLRQAEGASNITVMQTHFPASRWNDGAWVDAQRLHLLCDALAGPLKNQFDHPVQWFYDPMSVSSFAGQVHERAVVYDCMDELSQFKGAPRELVQRERELLRVADVVFAGGRKMHESKSRFNSNCYFYGCGVDTEHFGKARQSETSIPEDIAHLDGKVLGYFGVVDERMDYELVARLADARADWNIVIVGPVTKVDPDTLPQRPNLHWLGGRDYAQLPAYTKRFDVCLMPFALNEATEYINPTKALEYMATGTPIVSTPVPDVVSNFSQALQITYSADSFAAMCQRALENPDRAQIERGLKMADENTWDAIVAKLEAHIDDALLVKAHEAASVQTTQKLRDIAALDAKALATNSALAATAA